MLVCFEARGQDGYCSSEFLSAYTLLIFQIFDVLFRRSLWVVLDAYICSLLKRLLVAFLNTVDERFIVVAE